MGSLLTNNKKMKYFKIKYNDGRYIFDKAEDSLELIKKHELYTKENINTIIIQLEGEQEAIAISNDQED
jgi:hypothetical protein